MTTAVTDIARIEPQDLVAISIPGFYALRRSCIAYEEWELIEDDWKAAQYAMSEDGRLMCAVSELYQEARQDSALTGSWGVPTGTGGLATVLPRYVVRVDGREVVLADAYPGAYEAAVSARIGY